MPLLVLPYACMQKCTYSPRDRQKSWKHNATAAHRLGDGGRNTTAMLLLTSTMEFMKINFFLCIESLK